MIIDDIGGSFVTIIVWARFDNGESRRWRHQQWSQWEGGLRRAGTAVVGLLELKSERGPSSSPVARRRVGS